MSSNVDKLEVIRRWIIELQQQSAQCSFNLDISNEMNVNASWILNESRNSWQVNFVQFVSYSFLLRRGASFTIFVCLLCSESGSRNVNGSIHEQNNDMRNSRR